MRWKAKDPFRWRRGFAWLPIKIGEQWLWLERYWHRDQCEYRQVSLVPYCCDQLRGGMWIDGQHKPAWCPVHGDA